jgi:hypothetical protein
VPFGREQLGVTGILACLACHGLVLNLLETWITHTVERHPRWQEFLAAEAEERAARAARQCLAASAGAPHQHQHAASGKAGGAEAGAGEAAGAQQV